MAATDLQAFLRFLSQDAKVPLATAIGKIKELQKASLDSPESLAKVKAKDLQPTFDDEKIAKQIVTAAKRISKKRAAGEDAAPSPKKSRKSAIPDDAPVTPQQLEASIALPKSSATEDELSITAVVSNRAPLVLAFAVVLLKHTMPEQPLSSRLSLAQAYVSTTSRARAVNLGIQQLDRSEVAAEEKLAEGQPSVTIMGKELRVLRRWGYEWRDKHTDVEVDTQGTLKAESQDDKQEVKDEGIDADGSAVAGYDEQPPLWALDLEALRKSNRHDAVLANVKAGNNSSLPIYTPQSARAYLLKSFDSLGDEGAKKPSAAVRVERKERNLGHLLRALDLLYESWAPHVTPEELDKRTWSWYVNVRPAVEDGVAGWGGKNQIKLADILALRRVP